MRSLDSETSKTYLLTQYDRRILEVTAVDQKVFFANCPFIFVLHIYKQQDLSYQYPKYPDPSKPAILRTQALPKPGSNSPFHWRVPWSLGYENFYSPEIHDRGHEITYSGRFISMQTYCNFHGFPFQTRAIVWFHRTHRIHNVWYIYLLIYHRKSSTLYCFGLVSFLKTPKHRVSGSVLKIEKSWPGGNEGTAPRTIQVQGMLGGVEGGELGRSSTFLQRFKWMVGRWWVTNFHFGMVFEEN